MDADWEAPRRGPPVDVSSKNGWGCVGGIMRENRCSGRVGGGISKLVCNLKSITVMSTLLTSSPDEVSLRAAHPPRV